jgi:glycine oxidase
MADLKGMRIAIAGAGVFGLSTGLRAAASGAAVEVWDPAPLGDNASGVAAGMIAPAGERVFDRLDAAHLDLLLTAQRGWPALQALAPDLKIDRSGAVFLFDSDAERAGAMARLTAGGLHAKPLDERERPEYAAASPRRGVFSADDWRVDAPAALLALKRALLAAGGVFKTARLRPDHVSAFDAAILATGIDRADFGELAPETSVLMPIKGQLLKLDGGPEDGPILRAADVYLAPQPSGAVVGATMEPGLCDRTVDADVLDALRSRLARWAPDLAKLPGKGFAAVRAATPDGLPLAGPSSTPGLFLATGARRNGWLLAPLVSEMLVSYLGGGDGGPFAAALDPRRFDRT